MNRDGKGESKRRPAAARGRRRQGRQQRTGEEKVARAEEVGACSSNSVQRGVPDHPRANTSVQERKAPEQHPQHVEGRAPHRAEAFVAMRKSEDRKLDVTTLHTTRHGNRAVTRYNQIPGGRDQQKTDWTRRPQGTNRGGGQDEWGTLPGGNKPIRSNPKTNKKNAQNNRGRHKQHPPKAKSHTQHPRTNTGKRPNQPQPTHQGQAAQADYQSRPIDTGPNTPTGDKQNKKKEYTQGTEGQPDNRGERRPKVKRNKRGGETGVKERAEGGRVSTSYGG